jgi:hypothetical protein
MGLNFGVLASLLYGAYFVAPGPVPTRVSWNWRRLLGIVGGYAKRGLLYGLAGGLLLLGSAIFFSRPLPAAVPTLWRALAYVAVYAIGPLGGVLYGTFAGVFAAIASGLEDSVDLTRSTDPAQSLAADGPEPWPAAPSSACSGAVLNSRVRLVGGNRVCDAGISAARPHKQRLDALAAVRAVLAAPSRPASLAGDLLPRGRSSTRRAAPIRSGLPVPACPTPRTPRRHGAGNPTETELAMVSA